MESESIIGLVLGNIAAIGLRYYFEAKVLGDWK